MTDAEITARFLSLPIRAAEADPSGGCLTVAQLKALVADWPELDRDGEPNGVWIETGRNLSSPVVYAGPLNYRPTAAGEGWTADLILESALWHDSPGEPD